MAPPEVTKMLSNKATELVAKYGGASATIGGAFVLVGDFDYRDKTKKELEDYIYSIELQLNNMNFHAKALQELLTQNMDTVVFLLGEKDCPHSVRTVTLEEWQTRPIEDALTARIAELEAALAEALPYEINEKIRRGEFTTSPEVQE